MSLRQVCRVKIYNNGFAVEYPSPLYAHYFQTVIADKLKASGGVLEVIVGEPTETDNQAFMRLFHALRDGFAKHWNQARTQVEADLIQEFGIREGLKRRLKTDYGSVNEDQKLKSLTNYSRGEWISLIRGVLTEAMEQGMDIAEVAIEFGGRSNR